MKNPHLAVGSGPRTEVYDSCHTFLHVARVRKHTDMRELHAFHTDMRELHAFRVQFSHFACNSRMSVCFLTRSTCKNVRQNLIPRATAYLLRAVGPRFQIFSTIQGKTRAKHLLSLLLRGSTIARITGPHTGIWQTRSPAPGPTPSAPKQ